MKPFALLALALLSAAAAADLPLIQPKDLAAQLSSVTGKPAIIQVGPNLLFRSHHIPGAVYGGPASKPEGLEALKAAVKDLPHDRDIVIYCGCCPWDRCPNIKPALALLKELGFTNVKAMYSGTNFKTDWIDPGYPVDPPADKGL
ncbi:MAG TPA: rhodanese-like domain-containing protein [Bryobacteraceae bacterium]|nr:rhodanese-like domain-containing protein [Bryobacteraceae bacterium]